MTRKKRQAWLRKKQREERARLMLERNLGFLCTQLAFTTIDTRRRSGKRVK